MAYDNNERGVYDYILAYTTTYSKHTKQAIEYRAISKDIPRKSSVDKHCEIGRDGIDFSGMRG